MGNDNDDNNGDGAGGVSSVWPPDRSQLRLAQIERIRVLTLQMGRQVPDLPSAAESDARLVARMVALLEEAMEIARMRSGEEGRAMIDTLAVEIFRVISAGQIAAEDRPRDKQRR